MNKGAVSKGLKEPREAVPFNMLFLDAHKQACSKKQHDDYCFKKNA